MYKQIDHTKAMLKVGTFFFHLRKTLKTKEKMSKIKIKIKFLFLENGHKIFQV